MVALREIKNWWQWIVGESSGDDRMTAERALSYPPVWHCVSKISGAFMIMPLNVHQKTGRDSTKKTTHPSYKLLRWRPNAYQTPSQWKRQMVCHALLWGNARSFVRRVDGKPVELIPLMPDRTVTQLVDGVKWHATVIDRDDRLSLWQDMQQNQEKTIYLPDEDVWHVPGLGFDGVEGKSLITLARQSWGIGLGSETHIAKQQKKGYAGAMFLEAPPNTPQLRDAGAAKEFLEDFRKQHEGAENAGKIGLLREGIKANVVAMSNQDAQFIEQRRFQREDAALLFLLEGILGDSSNASYASMEQRALAFRTNCLAPWTTAMEEESDLKLLTQSERDREFYHKFNDGALLRTEKAATMTFISQGRTCGVLSQNDGREMLDMPMIEDGDTYENPNTSTGKPDNGPGGASNQPAETKAMQAMFGNLLTVEANRCRDAAKNPAKFMGWIESFYASWETKLADDIEKLGGDRELATEHCAESKRRLLDACDCQPEQLADVVAKCVESWPGRSHQLIEELLPCSK